MFKSILRALALTAAQLWAAFAVTAKVAAPAAAAIGATSAVALVAVKVVVFLVAVQIIGHGILYVMKRTGMLKGFEVTRRNV